MTAVLDPGKWGTGRVNWEGTRDSDGYRTFTITHRVKSDYTDGPATVMYTPGLPAVGSSWNFGGDFDFWAWCYPDMSVKYDNTRRGNAKHKYWLVSQTFSNKPLSQRCNTLSIENPLAEPQKLSGSFVKYTREATRDKDGNAILTSSKELIRGPSVEFDTSLPTVSISQNVPYQELPLFSAMIDHVNVSPMWGLAARCVKLSNITWSRQYYGLCNVYYTRSFEFDINPDTFDRTVLDEGTRVLHGRWGRGGGEGTGWVVTHIHGTTPSASNPNHFIQYKDRNGELGKAVLDGAGKPWNGTGSPGTVEIDYYPEANFFLLGVPVALI